jgi:adenosylhomocysteine nucleosidase
MNKIIFIAALKEELENTENISGIPVIYSGIGKINAAIASTKAYYLGFNKIINIGSCGSVNHKVGEILKIGEFYQDIDCTPLCEYGKTFYEEDKIIINDSPFSCFTTDYFYDYNQKSKYSFPYLHKINNCSVFDMESYSMAKVCKVLNINFECYKWVSDDGESKEWENNCKIGFEKFRKMFEKQ